MSAHAMTAARQVSFSAQLRERTRGEHEQVERSLGLPDRLETFGDLALHLQGWRSVWSEVRAGCGPAGHDEAARLLVSSVRAVQQISADLRALSMNDDSDVTALRPPVALRGDVEPRPGGLAALLETEPGMWAVSYVLRGSRVGGAVLAPLIAQRLRLPDGVATGYHADATSGRSWVAFRGRLDTWGLGSGPSGRRAALDLTREVFDLVSARLLESLPPESRRPPEPQSESARREQDRPSTTPVQRAGSAGAVNEAMAGAAAQRRDHAMRCRSR